MTFMAAIIVGGAALAGSVYAANKQSSAASKAIDTQKNMFGTVQGMNQPFVQQGQNAIGSLGDWMGTSGNTGASGYGQGSHQFGAGDLNSNLAPNYQWQLSQGQLALDRAGSANGGQTGNFATGMQNYTQNTAANAYQQAYNNYNTNQTNIYNRLAGIAGLGQASANNTAAAGTTLAGNTGSAQLAQGSYQAAGGIGASNAISSGLVGQSMFNYLNPGSGSSGGGVSGGSGLVAPPNTWATTGTGG